MEQLSPGHIVCIFGGAVAGSEAAYQLTQRGIYCVVLDQDVLPYGKIEHGLPKWHIKLRDKEEEKIDEKLNHPLVRYVPSTKLGTDLLLEDVLGLGFSAVLLAVGAWKDRPLPVAGVDDCLDKGFYYQNPFVMWFNQHHSPEYKGPQLEIADDAIVVGGGLASIDVVKILMFETVLEALKKRGLEAEMFTMDKKGIPHVLESLGVRWEDLGLKGCTLYYRRRAVDMPLNEIPDDTPPDKAERLRAVREKLMANFQSKYLFRFEPQCVPVDKIVQEGRLAGLTFRRTQIEKGRAVEIPGSDFDVRSELTISSIGSLPEPTPGLPFDRDLLRIENEETGKLIGFENVFALGNTVTGRGNIRASFVHGRQVANYVMDEFLAWRAEDYERLLQAAEERASEKASRIAEFLEEKRLRGPEELRRIFGTVDQWQRRVAYPGDYAGWARQHRPIRLENLIGYGE